MLDITYIRQNQDDIIVMLRNRLLENEIPRVTGLLELDRQRR